MLHKYLIGTVLALAAVTSQADTLLIENVREEQQMAQQLPKSGTTMQAVEAQFGAPNARRGPVGDPPITRWEYDGYVVYFEYDRVIHAVLRHGS